MCVCVCVRARAHVCVCVCVLERQTLMQRCGGGREGGSERILEYFSLSIFYLKEDGPHYFTVYVNVRI